MIAIATKPDEDEDVIYPRYRGHGYLEKPPRNRRITWSDNIGIAYLAVGSPGGWEYLGSEMAQKVASQISRATEEP